MASPEKTQKELSDLGTILSVDVVPKSPPSAFPFIQSLAPLLFNKMDGLSEPVWADYKSFCPEKHGGAAPFWLVVGLLKTPGCGNPSITECESSEQANMIAGLFNSHLANSGVVVGVTKTSEVGKDFVPTPIEELTGKVTDAQEIKSFYYALAQAGFTADIIADFDGSGDSGEVTNISCTDGCELPKILTELVDMFVMDALESHGVDWYNNEGGFGEVTICLKDRTISVSCNQRITEIDHSSSEFCVPGEEA